MNDANATQQPNGYTNTRWQDDPEIKAKLDRLYELTGSSNITPSLTDNFIIIGARRNLKSKTVAEISQLKTDINRLRREWITAQFRAGARAVFLTTGE